MFLEIGNYGLFESADTVTGALSQSLLLAGSLLAGGFLIAALVLPAILLIAVVSLYRGAINRSVPKAIGTFFRLSGLVFGLFLALLVLPVAIFLKASIATMFITSAGIVLVSYFIGRALSKLIGFRIQKYSLYLRSFDILRLKVARLVNSI